VAVRFEFESVQRRVVSDLVGHGSAAWCSRLARALAEIRNRASREPAEPGGGRLRLRRGHAGFELHEPDAELREFLGGSFRIASSMSSTVMGEIVARPRDLGSAGRDVPRAHSSGCQTVKAPPARPAACGGEAPGRAPLCLSLPPKRRGGWSTGRRTTAAPSGRGIRTLRGARGQ